MRTTYFHASEINIQAVNAVSTTYNNRTETVNLIYVNFESDKHKKASFTIDRKEARKLIKQLEKKLRVKKLK